MWEGQLILFKIPPVRLLRVPVRQVLAHPPVVLAAQALLRGKVVWQGISLIVLAEWGTKPLETVVGVRVIAHKMAAPSVIQ